MDKIVVYCSKNGHKLGECRWQVTVLNANNEKEAITEANRVVFHHLYTPGCTGEILTKVVPTLPLPKQK